MSDTSEFDSGASLLFDAAARGWEHFRNSASYFAALMELPLHSRIAELERELADAQYLLETRIEIGWYFFESEYAEEGITGPYQTRDEAERKARDLYEDGDQVLSFEEQFSFRHFGDVMQQDATIREQAETIERLSEERERQANLFARLRGAMGWQGHEPDELVNAAMDLRDKAETIERLKADAERLDWLSEQHGQVTREAGGHVTEIRGCYHSVLVPPDHDIREAIDAARDGEGQ